MSSRRRGLFGLGLPGLGFEIPNISRIPLACSQVIIVRNFILVFSLSYFLPVSHVGCLWFEFEFVSDEYCDRQAEDLDLNTWHSGDYESLICEYTSG